LMWGDSAVGKLTAGSDPLKPEVQAFVDDEAGPDVAAKVQRRLQHFIDRKTATLFEPLHAMAKDEALSGIARGFSFRMIEAFGVIPRDAVAQEVKDLDQTARGQLRKHGIRFGQFTIFLPALLKPAPTRLRLVLWSLASGFDVFPESPPPGLVTVPAQKDAPDGYYAMSGYRLAGERAIRIDMLERLADMLRGENSRGGFEANPDMLSITGLTLEQFASLMEGLGYKAERAEREKVRAVPAKPADADAAKSPDDAEVATDPETEGQGSDDTDAKDAPDVTASEIPDPVPDDSAQTSPTEESDAAADEGPEIEVYYTFTWGGNRPRREGRGRPQGKGRPKSGKPKGKPGPRDRGAKTFESRPPKKDRIDPDNPFAAALMGLKTKD